MLFGVCIEHEYDLIMFMQYGYSFKLENNCCSVYMNKNLLWSYTPTKMFCWISIVVIHIFIILMPKDAKLIMIVQLIVALPFRSYWCKAHEETPY